VVLQKIPVAMKALRYFWNYSSLFATFQKTEKLSTDVCSLVQLATTRDQNSQYCISFHQMYAISARTNTVPATTGVCARPMNLI
jgi:alkylhydroperoxidase family enzyme